MKPNKYLSIISALALLPATSHAIIILGTDFNGRTATGAVASDLNWTTNGVADPGSMSSGTTLFDGTALTQNLFAPALNYGNQGGTWTSLISITVTAGSLVTIENVTFDYFAIGGTQVQQGAAAPRVADFKVDILDPSSVNVGTFSANDLGPGTDASGTPITATFTPIALTAPGTYTLRIEVGEIGGVDETGNHAGIDNLSINGTVSAIPEPSSTALLGLAGLFAIARRRR